MPLPLHHFQLSSNIRFNWFASLCILYAEKAKEAQEVSEEFNTLLDNLNDYQSRVEGYCERKSMLVSIFQVACNTGLSESQVWEAITISESLKVNGSYVEFVKTEEAPVKAPVSGSKGIKGALATVGILCASLASLAPVSAFANEVIWEVGSVNNPVTNQPFQTAVITSSLDVIITDNTVSCLFEGYHYTELDINDNGYVFEMSCKNKVVTYKSVPYDSPIDEFKTWSWARVKGISDFNSNGVRQALSSYSKMWKIS